MTPIQDMTLDECRDEIAVAMGWVRDRPSVCATGSWRGPDNAWMHGLDHPVPATIDSIAANLPPGWFWWLIRCDDDGVVQCRVWSKEKSAVMQTACADTEILARARCCVAAWRKYKENAQ
jgi:hypothetical protein